VGNAHAPKFYGQCEFEGKLWKSPFADARKVDAEHRMSWRILYERTNRVSDTWVVGEVYKFDVDYVTAPEMLSCPVKVIKCVEVLGGVDLVQPYPFKISQPELEVVVARSHWMRDPCDSGFNFAIWERIVAELDVKVICKLSILSKQFHEYVSERSIVVKSLNLFNDVVSNCLSTFMLRNNILAYKARALYEGVLREGKEQISSCYLSIDEIVSYKLHDIEHREFMMTLTEPGISIKQCGLLMFSSIEGQVMLSETKRKLVETTYTFGKECDYEISMCPVQSLVDSLAKRLFVPSQKIKYLRRVYVRGDSVRSYVTFAVDNYRMLFTVLVEIGLVSYANVRLMDIDRGIVGSAMHLFALTDGKVKSDFKCFNEDDVLAADIAKLDAKEVKYFSMGDELKEVKAFGDFKIQTPVVKPPMMRSGSGAGKNQRKGIKNCGRGSTPGCECHSCIKDAVREKANREGLDWGKNG